MPQSPVARVDTVQNAANRHVPDNSYASLSDEQNRLDGIRHYVQVSLVVCSRVADDTEFSCRTQKSNY
jgi:hypothetical protein